MIIKQEIVKTMYLRKMIFFMRNPIICLCLKSDYKAKLRNILQFYKTVDTYFDIRGFFLKIVYEYKNL